MALFLEIISGNLSGTRTRLQNGLVIGRREGDLTIRDSKVSSKHAQVVEEPDGRFRLVDLGSANGIKLEDGRRVRELDLEEGLTFILGRTHFKVVSTDELIQSDEVATSILAETVTRTYWDNVRELVENALKKAKAESSRREVVAFSPVVRLRFTQGIQMGTEWTVGYGPRMIGTGSIDLHLEDPSLPSVCFRLLPENDGTVIRFKNETDKEVRLNGKWVETDILKDSDVIDIGTTQIRVIFDEGNS